MALTVTTALQSVRRAFRGDFRAIANALEAVINGDFLPASLTATAAEINARADNSGRVLITTATVYALSSSVNAGRRLVVKTNSTVANSITVPTATGSGDDYEIINGIAQTQGSIVFTRATSTLDVFKGVAIAFDSSALATHATAFSITNGTSITWNNTDKGGGVGNDRVFLVDEATNVWRVEVRSICIAAPASPFA